MKFPCILLNLAGLILTGLAFYPVGAGAAAPGHIIYVAASGNDAHTGTKEKPFATLDRARDEIRRLKTAGPLPVGGVTVEVAGGIFERSTSFELADSDSGTATSPIVYRARRGEEVRLVGGRELTRWKPVVDPSVLARMDPAAHGKALRAELRAQGIENFGALSRRGHTLTADQSGLELFFAGEPMPLARWPNQGWTRIVGTPAGQYGGQFTYEGDRPKRWTRAEDIWLHGYWTFAWADSYEKVRSIELERRLIKTEPPHGIHGYTPDRRFYALNLLEELDEPGEWYLDRKTGSLYFWPPTPLERGRPTVSLLDNPLLTLTNASFITLRGFTFECGRASGVVMSGGTSNQVVGCTFRNLGTFGVSIGEGGPTTHSGVVGCDIYNVGEAGIRLEGGDRMTLCAGENFAVNNDIHHYSRWVFTYQPAIFVKGVGQRVAHNRIHEAPHIGILFLGNDHRIEFNDISRVCLQTGDAGAVYTGCDLTARGTIIRYNSFHDIARSLETRDGYAEVMSVYLDDCASGMTVLGNIFNRGGRAILIGGGRDNLIENNIFVDCSPAIHVDGRAESWMKANFYATNGPIMTPLRAVPYDRPPYSTRYPHLANILNDEPGKPKYNRILRNISIGGKWIDWLDGLDETKVEVRDNLTNGDPGFVGRAQGDFRLRQDSPALRLGFRPIPLEQIGLLDDDTRASRPVKHAAPENPQGTNRSLQIKTN